MALLEILYLKYFITLRMLLHFTCYARRTHIFIQGGKFRYLVGEPGYTTPKAIDDPKVYVEMYRRAAINAKAAGFDGVELHNANGMSVCLRQ